MPEPTKLPTAKKSSVRPDCFACAAKDRTEWCALSHSELEIINNTKIAREYMPGEVLFHQGDPCTGIYCFEYGMVGVRKVDAEGNSILLGISFPGDTLGYRSLLVGGEHHVSAEALKPTTVCFIDKATVRTLLDQNPALGLQYLRRAVEAADVAEEKFLQSVTLSVRARFAHLLLVLKERYQTESKTDDFTLELPLSRQDLAAMIGIRPETMSRTIKQLENDGIAHFSGRTVRVPKLDNLFNELEMEHFL
jgi:CRP-like cAMP-binding protein